MLNNILFIIMLLLLAILGGMSVMNHVLSPMSAGLFRYIIITVSFPLWIYELQKLFILNYSIKEFSFLFSSAAIVQSGAPLTPFVAINKHPAHYGYKDQLDTSVHSQS